MKMLSFNKIINHFPADYSRRREYMGNLLFITVGWVNGNLKE